MCYFSAVAGLPFFKIPDGWTYAFETMLFPEFVLFCFRHVVCKSFADFFYRDNYDII